MDSNFHIGQKQTFDYNHQSRPIHDVAPVDERGEEGEMGGFRKREVFDYNHQHPSWSMGPPPPLPPPPQLGPPPPFPPDPRWGPPPPPDLPPPIPYFDLPAGLMVAIVPVSFPSPPHPLPFQLLQTSVSLHSFMNMATERWIQWMYGSLPHNRPPIDSSKLWKNSTNSSLRASHETSS